MSLIVLENFIDGEFCPSKSHIDTFEPSTGRVFAYIPDSGKDEVEIAVEAAARAFPGWSSLSAVKRAKFLLKVADLLESRLDEFARAESRDQGKPVWLTKQVDIPRAVQNFRHFAHTVPHHLDTCKINSDSNTVNYTRSDPIGIAGVISPWNLPLYLLTFKLAPALATGNTVVAKPSELTSLTTFMLCKIFQEVGLPKGVVNVVFGLGSSVGDAIVTNPKVPLISFTGSTVTGRIIAQKAAPLFKKLSLEMGGKNAALVFSDAKLNAAIPTLVRGSFINQGQVCLCTSRIFVQKDIYEEFLEKFLHKTKTLVVGNSSDADVFMGALNSKGHLEKVKCYVRLAIEEGGTVLCGETKEELKIADGLKEGYYMLPTVITGLSSNSRCMQEEIFGPVTCIVPFETEEEVLMKTNGTPYGLCASLWTSDVSRANRVAAQLKVGTVWTNCWMVRDMDLPFGGSKMSGIGREGTKDSLEFYTEVKTICTQLI